MSWPSGLCGVSSLCCNNVSINTNKVKLPLSGSFSIPSDPSDPLCFSEKQAYDLVLVCCFSACRWTFSESSTITYSIFEFEGVSWLHYMLNTQIYIQFAKQWKKYWSACNENIAWITLKLFPGSSTVGRSSFRSHPAAKSVVVKYESIWSRLQFHKQLGQCNVPVQLLTRKRSCCLLLLHPLFPGHTAL